MIVAPRGRSTATSPWITLYELLELIVVPSSGQGSVSAAPSSQLVWPAPLHREAMAGLTRATRRLTIWTSSGSIVLAAGGLHSSSDCRDRTGCRHQGGSPHGFLPRQGSAHRPD